MTNSHCNYNSINTILGRGKYLKALLGGMQERESLSVLICIFKGLHSFERQAPSCGTNSSEILFSRLPALPSLVQTPFLQIDAYDFPCIAACVLAPQDGRQNNPLHSCFSRGKSFFCYRSIRREAQQKAPAMALSACVLLWRFLCQKAR